MQADSLQTTLDTIRAQKPDTNISIVKADTVKKESVKKTASKKEISIKPNLKPKVDKVPVQEKPIVADTIISAQDLATVTIEKPVKLFPNLASRDSSQVSTRPEKLTIFTSELTTDYIIEERSAQRSKEKGWVFSSGLAAFILIIIIQIYYKKQFSSVQSALFNMRLADKLMREKNVMLKRLYFLLNTLYIFSLSLFLYNVVNLIELNLGNYKGFNLYAIIFGIVFTIILIRNLINRIVAYLFEAEFVFREYDYNNLIINKNLGVVLLPILLSSYFVPSVITPYFFTIAAIIVVLATLLRYFKAVQLIMKHNVFLFYSILYLCTLEILPILVGVKYALTLR